MPDFYGDVASADSYHTARGNAGWAGTDEAKQAALVRASAYVDSLAQHQVSPPNGPWMSLFRGTKTGGRGQALAWPRMGATDNEGLPIDNAEVPVEVEHATYEAALRELTAPGSLRPDYVASSVVKREKVDVLEVEYAVSAASGSAADITPVVTVITALLAPLMRPASAGIGLMVV